MVDARGSASLWREVRNLREFWRLLELRVASQFGDGLFQAGLAGGLLFNPERAANPWAVAGAFAVLFLPYSTVGPFAGALLDRWDRRAVFIGANVGRLVLVIAVGVLLATGTDDFYVLCGALLVNGFGRFVQSGLSAALPHVVPRERIVTMNSVATATGATATFLGANFMLLPRWIAGDGDTAAATVIFLVAIPVTVALFLSLRFPTHELGPDETARAIHGSTLYTVATGWQFGARTVASMPSVASTLSGLAAHRMVFGINTLLVLVIVRHSGSEGVVAGFGTAVVFVATTGLGAFLANLITPAAISRWGRYATANGALIAAAVIQVAGATLHLGIMVTCGFLLGMAGQVVKLCADSAIQIDVDDALRGHVFAVQDSLFWMSFLIATIFAAGFMPIDGRSPGLAIVGSVIYLIGLAVHGIIGRRRPAAN